MSKDKNKENNLRIKIEMLHHVAESIINDFSSNLKLNLGLIQKIETIKIRINEFCLLQH